MSLVKGQETFCQTMINISIKDCIRVNLNMDRSHTNSTLEVTGTNHICRHNMIWFKFLKEYHQNITKDYVGSFESVIFISFKWGTSFLKSINKKTVNDYMNVIAFFCHMVYHLIIFFKAKSKVCLISTFLKKVISLDFT